MMASYGNTLTDDTVLFGEPGVFLHDSTRTNDQPVRTEAEAAKLQMLR